MKVQLENQERFIEILQKQRDKAHEELAKNSQGQPWYFWVILGAAGGVILTKGLR